MSRTAARVTPVEWLARAGYGARGLVYLVIGAFAVMAAVEVRRSTAGSEEALQVVSRLPLGGLWLLLLGGGLLGFVLWRVAQAAFDADRQGSTGKALARRAGQGISALVYGALAFSCLTVLRGAARDGGDSQRLREVLSLPFGEILLSGVGVAVLVAGLLNGLHGLFGGFRRHLCCGDEVHRWAVPIARAGYFARGLVFVILGVFLVEAALDLSPTEAATIGGALQMVEDQPFGSAILALAGAGLMAFGLFGFVEARYRRIVVPDELGG
jgi:hypothetical protein